MRVDVVLIGPMTGAAAGAKLGVGFGAGGVGCRVGGVDGAITGQALHSTGQPPVIWAPRPATGSSQSIRLYRKLQTAGSGTPLHNAGVLVLGAASEMLELVRIVVLGNVVAEVVVVGEVVLVVDVVAVLVPVVVGVVDVGVEVSVVVAVI